MINWSNNFKINRITYTLLLICYGTMDNKIVVFFTYSHPLALCNRSNTRALHIHHGQLSTTTRDICSQLLL